MDEIELFKKLLSFRSITPYDDGAFEFIDDFLGTQWQVAKLNFGEVKNRVYIKKFGNSDINICFAGHIDVVPAGDGWNTNPFKPTIKNRKIFARGSQDMKSGVASFLYACKHTKNFKGTLTIVLTSDEEGEATHGTVKVLEYLKEQNSLPDFAVVAEPTCEKVFGDILKIGRRGSINGYLQLQGEQGHVAYPEKATNPIQQIASILPKISNKNIDDGDKFFAPSKLVITDIRAGMQVVNVTPNNLKLMFNVRNSTKTTQKEINILVDKYFSGLKYDFRMTQSSYPFVTNKNSLIVQKLQIAIKKVLKIDTKFSTAGGTSDARFFALFDIDVVEFGVINDKIHKANESTTIDEVKALQKIFKELLELF
ncbi:MAG: succinyl-diaminopimelate desuccinylase [Epsilonproteobacteria bacterium]|nr:MAG: succinyl-diaminopimelate desuccinylase [Campylobacterota bacterium]